MRDYFRVIHIASHVHFRQAQFPIDRIGKLSIGSESENSLVIEYFNLFSYIWLNIVINTWMQNYYVA